MPNESGIWACLFGVGLVIYLETLDLLANMFWVEKVDFKPFLISFQQNLH